jgi:hypothetical protein
LGIALNFSEVLGWFIPRHHHHQNHRDLCKLVGLTNPSHGAFSFVFRLFAVPKLKRNQQGIPHIHPYFGHISLIFINLFFA